MKLEAPNSWTDYNQHFLTTMDSPWYKFLVKLQNFITTETMKFYEKKGIITIIQYIIFICIIKYFYNKKTR